MEKNKLLSQLRSEDGRKLMKKVVMIDELDYKEVVSALCRLRRAVNSLETSYMFGELDVQLERIEKVFEMEES